MKTFILKRFNTKCLNILDYKAGFGGKFGIQKDRVDKSAVKSYEETNEKVGTNYEKTRPDGKFKHFILLYTFIHK